MFDPSNALRKMLGPRIGPSMSGFSNIAKGISKDVRSKNSNELFRESNDYGIRSYVDNRGLVFIALVTKNYINFIKGESNSKDNYLEFKNALGKWVVIDRYDKPTFFETKEEAFKYGYELLKR